MFSLRWKDLEVCGSYDNNMVNHVCGTLMRCWILCIILKTSWSISILRWKHVEVWWWCWTTSENWCRCILLICSLCGKNNICNQEVVHQIEEFTPVLPLKLGKKHVHACWHTVGWSQVESHQTLPPEKRVLKDPHTKSSSPYFETRSSRVGLAKELGPLERQDLLMASDQQFWVPH